MTPKIPKETNYENQSAIRYKENTEKIFRKNRMLPRNREFI